VIPGPAHYGAQVTVEREPSAVAAPVLPGALLAGVTERAADPTAADRPDAVGVAGRQLSDGGLLDAASALAAKLAGAPSVAVDATASLETIVAVVAGLIAGVPVVPVPADAGPREWSHVMGDSGATLLLGEAARLPSLDPADHGRHHPVDLLPVDAGARWSGRRHGGRPEPDGSAPALVLYTSGTTGPPKGVVVRRAAIAAGVDALADAWAWSADDVVVHGLPLFHVHGLVLGVLGALRLGGRVRHTARPTPEAYAAAVEGGGTLCFGVPTVWSRIAGSTSATALAAARLLVSGSAALPAPVFHALAARCGQEPVERYGMTETLITVSGRADGERRVGAVGLPLPGVRTRVVGEDGAAVAADGESVGALQLLAPTLMDRYLNLPEATAACYTPDGWFVTGDVACVDPDGYHRIVGRESTDLIKTGGFRVGAGEVEGALLAHPGVREVAVVGEPDDDLGQVIVAYVVSAGATGAELIPWVAETLSAHKRPRRVELVGALPRNAMGKVQKQQLGARRTEGEAGEGRR
jgi:fatty acid CoA ligase FadD36